MPQVTTREAAHEVASRDRSAKAKGEPVDTSAPSFGAAAIFGAFRETDFRKSSSGSFGSQHKSFFGFHQGLRDLAFLPVSQHERIRDAAALALELHQPAMVHDPVHQRRCQLVVCQNRAPLPELDVGRQHHQLALVAVRLHLEQQPAPVRVQWDVAELIQNQQVNFYRSKHRLVAALTAAKQ